MRILRPELERMALVAAATTYAALPVGVDWALVALDAAEWATTYSYDLVTGLNEYSQKVLRQKVPQFIDTPGQTIGDLRRELTPTFGPQRAESIAVTEVTRAYGEGERMMAARAQEAGLELTAYWQTVKDEKVCPLCAPLDGQPQNRWAELSPGADWVPRHPGCILPGNIVIVPGGAEAAVQSFYVGGAVEMRLENGSRLTVTKNHPILTGRGWVAADVLREGDYIFYGGSAQGIMFPVDPNDQEVPAAVEDIYRTLKESAAMATKRMPLATEDLHGEGACIEGDVNIVYPKSILCDGDKPVGSQPGGQRALYRANGQQPALAGLGLMAPFLPRRDAPDIGGMGGSNLGLSLKSRHPVPFEVSGQAAAARSNIRLQQATAESRAIGPGLMREGILRLSGQIAGQQQVEPRNSDPVALLASRRQPWQSRATEAPEDRIGMTAILQGQLTGSLAGHIAPMQIVDVRHFDYSGHVYDLQAGVGGIYMASGVIVKNCRCFIVHRWKA